MPTHAQRNADLTIGDVSEESFETMRQMVVVMAEANKRFQTLQIEAAHAALAENSHHFKSLLKNTEETTAAFAQWPGFFYAKAQRLFDLTSDFVEIASQTMIDVNQLIGGSSPISGTRSQKADVKTTGQNPERRLASGVFFFPERRHRAMPKDLSSDESAHGASPPPGGKKRHAA